MAKAHMPVVWELGLSQTTTSGPASWVVGGDEQVAVVGPAETLAVGR
ncbi:hypothetical protein [Nocardia sp. NPDC004722]